ncbi:MAG: transglutaminase domain-containing protein, partial [Oscillibacter sp.]|nr:transglutaminase domain-containing protein [Oscillibacter sp.]
GYCQHFAAAAVLMYRLYGVPARYAAGYAALPSSFAPVYGDEAEIGAENGETEGGPIAWYARITDRAAHAWAEIFLDGYGWTPVEVTPASADSAAGTQAAASYPGFDQEEQAEIAREHGWSNQRNDSAEKGEDDGSAAQNGDSVDNTNPADSGNPGVPEEQELDVPESEAETSPPPATLRHDGCLAGYLAFFLFTLLLLAPPVFISRRTRILAKIDAMDCREALYRLGNLLRFAGTPVEEEDFSTDLLAAVPVIAPEEAARLSSSASRAAFGPPSPGTEEDAFARGLYCRAAGWLYGTLNWRRRIFFRWFAVYR